jgi:hypothetical protein
LGSLLFSMPRLQPHLAADNVKRKVIWLRSFGAVSAKPLELRGNWPGLHMLGEIHEHAYQLTRHRATEALMVVGKKKKKCLSRSRWEFMFGGSPVILL